MGQYFGWGVGIADLTEDYRRRLSDARQKGASGAVFRLDWESLDGHSSFFTPNKINVYAGAALTRDLDTPDQEIYRRFLLEEGWSEDTGCISRQAKWFGNIMKKTWEITAGTVFVNDCVFSDSSVLPISLEHAVWLSEEKNSLKDWDPQKQDCVSPRRSSLEPAIREKEEAFKKISALCEEAGEYPEGLSQDKVKWFQERLALNARYVDMYRCGTEAILLTRYVTVSYTHLIDRAIKPDKYFPPNVSLLSYNNRDGDTKNHKYYLGNVIDKITAAGLEFYVEVKEDVYKRQW